MKVRSIYDCFIFIRVYFHLAKYVYFDAWNIGRNTFSIAPANSIPTWYSEFILILAFAWLHHHINQTDTTVMMIMWTLQFRWDCGDKQLLCTANHKITITIIFEREKKDRIDIFYAYVALDNVVPTDSKYYANYFAIVSHRVVSVFISPMFLPSYNLNCIWSYQFNCLALMYYWLEKVV